MTADKLILPPPLAWVAEVLDVLDELAETHILMRGEGPEHVHGCLGCRAKALLAQWAARHDQKPQEAPCGGVQGPQAAPRPVGPCPPAQGEEDER